MADPASRTTFLRLGGLTAEELAAVARTVRDTEVSRVSVIELDPNALGAPRFSVGIQGATLEVHAAIGEALQEIVTAWEGGAVRIAAEQIAARRAGHTLEHDLEHEDDILVDAALWYLCAGTRGWPFPGSPPKRPNKARCLEKAGALLASELDRLRAAPTTPES